MCFASQPAGDGRKRCLESSIKKFHPVLLTISFAGLTTFLEKLLQRSAKADVWTDLRYAITQLLCGKTSIEQFLEYSSQILKVCTRCCYLAIRTFTGLACRVA